MTNKIEIYRNLSSARSAAKKDLAQLLNVKNVVVELYTGSYGTHSAQCCCGQTAAYTFQPKSYSQFKKMQELGINGYTYGVCEHCGQ